MHAIEEGVRARAVVLSLAAAKTEFKDEDIKSRQMSDLGALNHWSCATCFAPLAGSDSTSNWPAMERSSPEPLLSVTHRRNFEDGQRTKGKHVQVRDGAVR